MFYEGIDTDQPYSAIREKILDHLQKVQQKKATDAYMKSLRDKAQIVVALQPPKAADLTIDGAPQRGSADAPVKFVEFADYECPYCKKVEPDVSKLTQEFGNKVVLIYMDYPLPMHPHAEKAAEAARCAGEQGKYWEFHDLLFADPSLDEATLKANAASLHLDTGLFANCLESGAQAAKIQKSQAEGARLGLSGTPSFFVNGHFVSGAVPPEMLRALIVQQLNEHGAKG
jgi:protein-disulfide isomerase